MSVYFDEINEYNGAKVEMRDSDESVEKHKMALCCVLPAHNRSGIMHGYMADCFDAGYELYYRFAYISFRNNQVILRMIFTALPFSLIWRWGFLLRLSALQY